MGPVEREIARLTNALRADPDGPLHRVKPMPACAEGDDYIDIDPVTGHPTAVPPLAIDTELSIAMSRDWSTKMAAAGEMTHRPGDSQLAIYEDLGIRYWTYGENVAWASGYEPGVIAKVFFEGWRESDTGHYCSMVSSRFDHFGVGHIRTDDGQDWGTQNFYGSE